MIILAPGVSKIILTLIIFNFLGSIKFTDDEELVLNDYFTKLDVALYYKKLNTFHAGTSDDKKRAIRNLVKKKIFHKKIDLIGYKPYDS